MYWGPFPDCFTHECLDLFLGKFHQRMLGSCPGYFTYMNVIAPFSSSSGTTCLKTSVEIMPDDSIVMDTTQDLDRNALKPKKREVLQEKNRSNAWRRRMQQEQELMPVDTKVQKFRSQNLTSFTVCREKLGVVAPARQARCHEASGRSVRLSSHITNGHSAGGAVGGAGGRGHSMVRQAGIACGAGQSWALAPLAWLRRCGLCHRERLRPHRHRLHVPLERLSLHEDGHWYLVVDRLGLGELVELLSMEALCLAQLSSASGEGLHGLGKQCRSSSWIRRVPRSYSGHGAGRRLPAVVHGLPLRTGRRHAFVGHQGGHLRGRSSARSVGPHLPSVLPSLPQLEAALSAVLPTSSCVSDQSFAWPPIIGVFARSRSALLHSFSSSALKEVVESSHPVLSAFAFAQRGPEVLRHLLHFTGVLELSCEISYMLCKFGHAQQVDLVDDAVELQHVLHANAAPPPVNVRELPGPRGEKLQLQKDIVDGLRFGHEKKRESFARDNHGLSRRTARSRRERSLAEKRDMLHSVPCENHTPRKYE